MRLMVMRFLLLALAPNSLDARSHSARWIIPARSAPAENVIQNRDGYFPIGTIVPAKLFRASYNITVARKNILAIPSGTLMIRLEDDPWSACELKRSRGSAYACITDSNRDGRFDTYFGTQVFNEILLGSIGGDSSFEPLSGPVDLAEIDSRTNTPRIDLELKFDGMSANGVRYRICTSISWPAKYYNERSCLRRPIQSQLDSTGSAVIFGQRVGFGRVRSKPLSLHVEHNRADVEFSTSFSL